MTNLTEQWKKEELPDGEYWCLSICGDVDKLYCYQNSFWEYKTEDDYYGVSVEIKQVLAPVPSYKEYTNLISRSIALSELDEMFTNEQEKNADLQEENIQLKELLKECKHIMSIEKDFASCHFEKDKLCKLLTKIAQVLGEE